MDRDFSSWLLVFFFYSFIGWLYEGTLDLVLKRKIVNRGFLIGPVCPIYGFGALAITLTLQEINNIVVVFLAAFVMCSVLEYITSYAMEKLFRVRWWDYSREKFNIHGRICLKASLCFGILGAIILKVVNPVLFGVLAKIHPMIRLSLVAILMIIFIVDIAMSLWIIMKYRVTVGTVNLDATDEITARVREVLLSKGKLNGRLAKAFPTMKVDKTKANQAHIHTEAKVQVKALKTQAKAIKTQAKARAKAVAKKST